jgi:hypothetical protein
MALVDGSHETIYVTGENKCHEKISIFAERSADL